MSLSVFEHVISVDVFNSDIVVQKIGTVSG